MRDGVIFEVTKDHLETGFYGVPAGYCVTSHVDAKKGLFYAGRPIAGLAQKTPEEVMFLLKNGEIGSVVEIEEFLSHLNRNTRVDERLVNQIESFPKTDRIMDAFSAAILMSGMYLKNISYESDAMDLIAKAPTLAAAVINSQAGWGKTQRVEEGSFVERLVQMLQIPKKNSELLQSALSLFTILSFDHGGGNLSTFIGKAVSSGLENMHGCIAAAMTSLGGRRHGGGCEEGFSFVCRIQSSLLGELCEDQVFELLNKEFEASGRLPGFGHAILQIEDPRATLCYDFCLKHAPNHPLVKLALILRKVGTKVLMEKSGVRSYYPNFDAISGVMLTVFGFEYLEYAPILFGLARTVGIANQIIYERLHAKGGKGTPIMRPSYIYRHRS